MGSYWATKNQGWGKNNTTSWCVWRQKSFPNRPLPSWERHFCESICSVPWRRVLEAKKYIHLYQNVASWNDTAGEEAFKNAKNRFWANMNGLGCNIELPDPDIYIDKVDFYDDDASVVDHELYLDLERCLEMQKARIESEVEILEEPFVLGIKGIKAGGWDIETDDTSEVKKELDETNKYGVDYVASGEMKSTNWQGGKGWGVWNKYRRNNYGGGGGNGNNNNGWGHRWERVPNSSNLVHDRYTLEKNNNRRNGWGREGEVQANPEQRRWVEKKPYYGY